MDVPVPPRCWYSELGAAPDTGPRETTRRVTAALLPAAHRPRRLAQLAWRGIQGPSAALRTAIERPSPTGTIVADSDSSSDTS
jgi:hypothetical protein